MDCIACREQARGGVGMTAMILNIERVRLCEAETWGALAGVVRATAVTQQGSLVAREALERVLVGMKEQERRASGKKDGRG
jgi:hypothetical protein